MSIYQNIFHYYRGQTKNNSEETQILQIENNVTKALLNVLQHSSPCLTRDFIQFLGLGSSGNQDFEYRYQVTSSFIENTPIAAVIGIAESKEVKKGTPKNHNIPDGAILSKDITLLIENKIGFNSYLGMEQLEGHKRNFSNRQYIIEKPIIVTWEEIRNFFKKKQLGFESESEIVSNFLLKQFEEFCIINCVGDRQKSKEYFFLRFEKVKARNLARIIDDYIWNHSGFNVEDAGTNDGIGYRKIGSIKFATLTTARQRCLILHVGSKEDSRGLQLQNEIDTMLKRKFEEKITNTLNIHMKHIFV